MRSALLALLPLLAGLRRETLLEDVLDAFDFEVLVEAEPAFDFVLPAALDLDVEDFFLLEEVPVDFCVSELWPVIGDAASASTNTTAAIGSAQPRRKSRRDKALISSLYLYLCLLDA